jgi:hypothetical protein
LRAKTVTIVVALAALISGGALVATLLTSGDDAAETEKLIPANAFLYSEGSWKVGEGQRPSCDALVTRFPGLEDCGSIGDKIREAIDEAASAEGDSYEADVEPWLGDDFVAFMTDENLGELIEGSQESQFDLAASGGEETSQEVELVAQEDDPADAPQPVAAALVTVTDDDAAREFLTEMAKSVDAEDRSYEGIDYFFAEERGAAIGLVSGHIVYATEPGIKAVIDQRDADTSLHDSERFANAIDSARDDRLGLAYFDLKPFIEVLRQQMPTGTPPGLLAPYEAMAERPGIVTAHLEEDGVVFETTASASATLGTPNQTDAAADAMRALPAGSWGAFAVGDVGKQAGTFLDTFAGAVPGGAAVLEEQFRRQTGLDLRRDVLSWMGASAFFIAGESPEELYGGVTIETSDPTTTVRTILRLERLTARSGQPTKIINRAGFRGFVAPEGRGQTWIFAADDRRAVAALGPLRLLDDLAAGPGLGDSHGFAAAQETLGEGFAIGGFLDIDVIRTLIEDSVPIDPVYGDRVRPYLDPLEHVVFGSQVEDDIVRTRVVIGVE